MEDIDAEIKLIRPEADILSKQGLPNFVGISGETAGTQVLSLNLIIIPAGGRATPHVHEGYETAIYMIQGHVDTRYGRRLEKSLLVNAGDFLFIPPGVPHEVINLSTETPGIAVVARSDPNEQERTQLYEVSDQ